MSHKVIMTRKHFVTFITLCLFLNLRLSRLLGTWSCTRLSFFVFVQGVVTFETLSAEVALVLLCLRVHLKVNIQDFLQVFQGSGIGKMEDNLTSADPLSYTTNGSRVDLENRVSFSCL